jgi:diguanylate cyclase (GGDEF)-like protein
METLKHESLAHLRHELRTPVNHILGYSELLIEDAHARHLEAFIPVFQQIQSGGRRLLQSIQTALAERTGSAPEATAPAVNLEAFKQSLRGTAAEVLETSTSLLEDLEYGHRQTLADLDAISWALRRLMEFTGQEMGALPQKPAKPARRTEPASRENISVPSRRRGGKILIADDDPGNRDLLRRRLEFEGHQAVEAKNGLEVLAALQDQECDLVLLDIMMPDMDGFQTLAKLKQEPELRELPVIMISALDELESVVRCIEMGAEDYLTKPFNRVLLRARIGASLEKKWLRDRERRKTDELEQTLQLLEQAQAQLAVQASQDALTGLENRRSVDAQLELRSKRQTPFSVIYIDLNGFKRINDTYGHQAGDDLLKQVGGRLRLAFRSADVVGRWGGDEFVALVEASLADAQIYISRITESFSKEFVLSSGETAQRVSLSAAVGFATWRPGESVAAALQRADAEMYEQKLRNSP